MPDLGNYAFYVLSAYAASSVVLIGITWASIARARRVKAELEKIEA